MSTTRKDRGTWVVGDMEILDALTVGGSFTITGSIVIAGDFEIGISGTGSDLKAWGDTAGYYMLWDADKDTNGGLIVIGTTTLTGNLTVDGTLVSIDGATSVRGISAGFTSLESPANRLGVNATIYMQVATAATTGITTITHTGTTPTVTWTADSFSLVGAFSADSASTAIVDGATSFRGVSAGFTSLESPANRLGLNATEYMQIATTVTTGITTITHTGSAPAVTWTADSLAFVGDLDVNGATVVLDGSTSVRGVSAAFNSLESPDNRFGSDAAVYMSIATTATTGVTAITHTGTGPTVTWTADSFDFVGAISLDGVTISGDVDSAGKLDFQYNPAAGSATGHIIKGTLTTATNYDTTTAGLMVKEYFADNACTVTGGEFTGVYVNVKQLAALTGGAKSSIISGHNYGSGGDYQSLDYGIILYGDLTAGYELSGGTSTYGIKMDNQTISAADVVLSSGAMIITGSADPNGSVTGVDGSMYLRTGTATRDTTLYLCQGTTTWTALTGA